MKDRRELLKGLAVGSVWATPVVSSIIIPAHGATTCGEPVPFDGSPEHVEISGICAGRDDVQICEQWVPCMAESCIEATVEDCHETED